MSITEEDRQIFREIYDYFAARENKIILRSSHYTYYEDSTINDFSRRMSPAAREILEPLVSIAGSKDPIGIDLHAVLKLAEQKLVPIGTETKPLSSLSIADSKIKTPPGEQTAQAPQTPKKFQPSVENSRGRNLQDWRGANASRHSRLTWHDLKVLQRHRTPLSPLAGEVGKPFTVDVLDELLGENWRKKLEGHYKESSTADAKGMPVINVNMTTLQKMLEAEKGDDRGNSSGRSRYGERK